MNNETKIKNTYNLKKIIQLIVSVVILILSFICVYNAPETKTGDLSSKITILFIIGLLTIFIIAWFIGTILGNIKGKSIIAKEDKFIKKNNPYIYFRELPNSFGIGVTSLLFNSTIENQKDIVAVILDLCARKYLNLIKQDDKYIIKVLKGIDENLLSNEKYILNMILDNNIKNVNYKEWYDYCMEDGINLGLYYYIEPKIVHKPILTKSRMFKKSINYWLIILTTTLLVSVPFLIFEDLMSAIKVGSFWILMCVCVLFIPFYFLESFTAIIHIIKQARYEKYKNVLENKLTRTKKGEIELQKLYSFKKFMNDFGYFINKQPDEVVLWDRYLSYAHVFGLTNEIMQSGYKELVNNSSFQIDNIDNITLYNLEVKE